MASHRDQKPRVVIVGAGVIGLSVGVCLSEEYGQQLDITIVADKFSPDTTSDRAGGFFFPIVHSSSDQNQDQKIRHWATVTAEYLKVLHQQYDKKITGLDLVPGLECSPTEEFEVLAPWMTEHFVGFRKLPQVEVAALGLPYTQYKSVWAFSTYILQCKKYLPWLLERFKRAGGLVETRKICNLSELRGYDVLVNCTGLGARELVGDKLVYPVRGQMLLVTNPPGSERKQFYIVRQKTEPKLTYIHPHDNYTVLGGTAQIDDWTSTTDPDVIRDIFSRCVKFQPRLSTSIIISSYSCLRPSRESIRLELEKSSENPPVVHCYGHEGRGITLHWGCAQEVVRMVEECLQLKTALTVAGGAVRSKL